MGERISSNRFLINDEGVSVNNAPSTLIIDSADLVKELRFQICSCVSERDMIEIITQVICTLLNEENNYVDSINNLPQFNRMRDDDYSDTNQNLGKIRKVTSEFGIKLQHRLQILGAYRGKTLPYFFDKLLGNDLVLSHLPY
jgi:hypothetical protein